MLHPKRVLAFALEKYGITPEELRPLGATPVQVRLSIPTCPDLYPGPARFRKLLAKSPEERRAGVHAWHVRQYERLSARMSQYEFETEYYNGDPVAMRVTVPARKLRSLLDLRCVGGLNILRIDGKRRRRQTRSEPAWFAVKARFVIQDEDLTQGMQDYEDRILLVQARSFQDAERKAMREFRHYGMVLLTATGHFYRWTFEAILDIYKTFIDEIDPNGMEVYSEMKKRRIKPEYEWHPVDSR